MQPFRYRNGGLYAEDVPLAAIAAEYGTPTYVYAETAVRERYRAFARAFAGIEAMICYALKANSNIAIIRALAREGAGADVVSVGEMRRALAAGVPPERVVFSGVGKTEDELAAGVEAAIMQFNVESESELELLDRVARARGRRAQIAIRVNPDVDAKTHAKITTGKKENKFGVPLDAAAALYARARVMQGVEAVSVAVHIGSQLLSLAPYAAAFRKLLSLATALRADGHAIRHLDLGGGLGIAYERETPPSPTAYAAMVKRLVRGTGFGVVLEPGRALVGNAGVLLTRVVHVKRGDGHRFAVVDAAMNDLIRPAMYDAHHEVVTVARSRARRRERVDIVGPICESADVLARHRLLAPLRAGDLLAIGSAGAYGAVMASTYNTRPLVAEVLVSGARHAVVRPRQSLEELLALDRMPAWLGN